MRDNIKLTAGLAMLMSANDYIPSGDDGEDAVFDVSYNGKVLHCTMTEEGETDPAFECTHRGFVSVKSAEGILRAAFDSVDIPEPVDMIKQFKQLVCGEEEA